LPTSKPLCRGPYKSKVHKYVATVITCKTSQQQAKYKYLVKLNVDVPTFVNGLNCQLF
jgi:hypothetical protein